MASDYINNLRNQFPILQREVNGKPLVYFDNGATSQKPQVVIDAITDYYTNYNSNIHRGVHNLSQDATSAYEEARELIHQYFNTQYLEDDHTLPRVNNIPCPNADCPTNSLEQKKSKKNINEVIYIIINESTMTFQYKCCNCKTTWKNK